jgi:hypothetical protein
MEKNTYPIANSGKTILEAKIETLIESPNSGYDPNYIRDTDIDGVEFAWVTPIDSDIEFSIAVYPERYDYRDVDGMTRFSSALALTVARAETVFDVFLNV